MYLFTELGCNIEAVDAKKNNALHLALRTNNMDLIRRLIHIDSDYGIMREHKNALGQTPIDVSEPSMTDYLITIWDRVKQGNIIKIRKYVQSNTLITNEQISKKTMMYHINMQTYTLRNTPLHIALMTGQASTIKTVLELGGDPLIRNAAEENAFDLALKVGSSPYIVKLLKKGLISQSILVDMK
jgi:ankyrin repeat protein